MDYWCWTTERLFLEFPLQVTILCLFPSVMTFFCVSPQPFLINNRGHSLHLHSLTSCADKTKCSLQRIAASMFAPELYCGGFIFAQTFLASCEFEETYLLPQMFDCRAVYLECVGFHRFLQWHRVTSQRRAWNLTDLQVQLMTCLKHGCDRSTSVDIWR